ncbi:MAG: acyltransferase [bacterium]
MSISPNPLPFIHHLAIVESKKIGCGTRIWAWTHVQEDVAVGDYCNIAEHCFLENGVRIGNRVVIKNGISLWEGITVADQAFLGPHVVFTNERFPRSGFPKPYEAIRIEQGASIGAGAVIVPGMRIGSFATVGAGSVVTRHVPDHALVFGNPARVQGWMCICGLRLKAGSPMDPTVCECGKKYTTSRGQCQLITS